MASQQYKDTEQLFEREIQRIEKATREQQSKLDDVQAGIDSEVQGDLESRRDKLAERRRKLGERDSDLESRYFKRRKELTKEQVDTGREIKLRYSIGRTEDDIRKEFGTQEADIDYEQRVVSKQEEYLDNDTRQESGFENNFEGRKAELGKEFGELERNEQDNFERLREELESKMEGYRELQAEVEDEIRSEFEGRYQQIIERVNNRNVQSDDELSERIKAILEIRGLLDNYDILQKTGERYRERLSIIKNGTWKEWN